MIELVLVCLWLSIAIINKAALLPLFILCVDILCFQIFLTDFPHYCIVALCYILLARTSFTISIRLRYALFAFGCVYWVGAFDNMLYNHSVNYIGIYYSFMPYLVISLNAYIAAMLYTDGGGNLARIAHAVRSLVNSRLARL